MGETTEPLCMGSNFNIVIEKREFNVKPEIDENIASSFRLNKRREFVHYSL